MRILFSTFLFLISSFFLFYGFNYTFWGDNRPGPGFFPIILGVLLTLLTAVNLIMEVRKSRLEKTVPMTTRILHLRTWLLLVS